jgi:ABC-type transporter Mla MlaB component
MKIQCLFDELNEQILQEATEIFHLVILSTPFNVNVSLEKVKYIDPKFINLLLIFSEELSIQKRSLSISYYPNSLSFLIKYIGYDHKVLIN